METTKKDRVEKILEGVDLWTGFYRKNPQRFAKDYLGIHLKWFQKILLYAMMHNYHFMLITSRG